MNNNLNFSKNIFGGTSNTKMAGPAITSYSQDGGRRSVEEVRNDQLNADLGINPNAGKEFQVELHQNNYQKPFNSQANTGAFIKPESQKDMFNNNQMPASNMQMDAARTKMQAMQDLNRRGF